MVSNLVNAREFEAGTYNTDRMSGYEEDEEDETGEEVEKTRLVTTLTMWRRLSNDGIGI
jgi:hypothetical protein